MNRILRLLQAMIGRADVYLMIVDRLKRWASWSATTARQLKALRVDYAALARESDHFCRQLERYKGMLDDAKKERDQLRADNNWLMERGFQFDSEGPIYHAPRERGLRVTYSIGEAWDRTIMEIKARTRYVAEIRVDEHYMARNEELTTLARLMRDSLVAHIIKSLGEALQNDLLKKQGADAVAKQKGKRP